MIAAISIGIIIIIAVIIAALALIYFVLKGSPRWPQALALASLHAALWVAPELADPIGPLEVGQHQDVEQLGAGSGTERVESLL
jgi:hypothetical protein